VVVIELLTREAFDCTWLAIWLETWNIPRKPPNISEKKIFIPPSTLMRLL
jgi:hypothetical protein